MNARGVALLVAVTVLAALGAITTTAIALARSERAAGLAQVAEVQARGAMEAAMAEALGGWRRDRTPTVPGEEVELAQFRGPGPAWGRAWLRSLGGPVYAIVGRGDRWDGASRLAASVGAELLVQLDSTGGLPGPDSMVSAKIYPRGWRLLP